MPVPTGLLSITRRTPLSFWWSAMDNSLTARTGQVATFARSSDNGIASTLDSSYRRGFAARNAPRFVRDPLSGEWGLLLERRGINYLLESNTIATSPWGTQNSPVVTANAIQAAGASLGSIVSTAVAGSNCVQGVAGVPAGPVTFSLDVKQYAGQTQDHRVAFYEHVLILDRYAYFAFNSSGVPVLGSVVGANTSWGPVETLADGAYRLSLIWTGFSGNDINVYVYPSPNNGATAGLGVYFGRTQLEALNYATSYSPTTTASVTRNVDQFYFTTMDTRVRTFTWYIKFVERGLIDSAGLFLATLGAIVQVTPVASKQLAIQQTATGYSVVHHNGTSSVASTLTTKPTHGQVVELAVTFNATTGVVSIAQSINGAAETTATPSGALTPASSWDWPYMVYGGLVAGGTGALVLQEAKHKPAVAYTVAQMRSAST